MTVVYCPRTHHFFGHEPHPFPKLLDAGVSVAVGTDGRCSNPDLNLHDELRFLHRTYPQLSAEHIVRLGTLDGARAVGSVDKIGSLAPGKQADFVVLKSPAAGDDPYEAILAPEAQAERVFYAGRVVATT
jgi:cytosine/adenosine deaminase-related metal-dependent hydrolase